ncbi:MAG: response regulator transcription factor [Anaerolineaceae bacterium]|nr:response regulator transcription factor [Anaerolineaceae bacterium]
MPLTNRILIVDDHTLVRHALHLMLDLKPGFEVVGEAQDGLEAISQTRRLQPDVILMDLEMPGMGGLEAISEIHREFPKVHILVLTSFVDDQKIAAAIKAGAVNYLFKNSSPAELVKAIQEVYKGRTNLSPEVASRLVAGLQQQDHSKISEFSLTRREIEILRLAASGLSNPEIASKLFISEGTVRFHFSNIFRKLQVTNRSQAILVALRQGWANLDEKH